MARLQGSRTCSRRQVEGGSGEWIDPRAPEIPSLADERHLIKCCARSRAVLKHPSHTHAPAVSCSHRASTLVAFTIAFPVRLHCLFSAHTHSPSRLHPYSLYLSPSLSRSLFLSHTITAAAVSADTTSLSIEADQFAGSHTSRFGFTRPPPTPSRC